MSWDASSDLASTLVAVAPSPPSSGLSLTVTAGTGAVFPAPPFDVLIQDPAAWPTRSTAELARVTAVSSDSLTIIRALHGTSARTVLVGDRVSGVFTAEQLQAVQAGVDANTTAVASNASAITAEASTRAMADTANAAAIASEAATARVAEALKAPLASPAFTGAPTAPTQTLGDNTTKIASTAFVLANGGGGPNAVNRTLSVGGSVSGATPLDMSKDQVRQFVLSGNTVISASAVAANGGQLLLLADQPVSGGPFTLGISDGTTTTPVTDPGWTAGQRMIVLVAWSSTSAYTAVVLGVAAAPVVPTVPGAPTGVVGTPGNTTASIAFTPPASNGGSAITGYTATLSPGGATFSGSSSPIAATGLTNGTTYTATVHATNAIGNSVESSASAGFTPNVTMVPGQPTGLSGTPGSGQVALTWTQPASNGGSAITDSLVQYRADPAGSWTTFAHSALGTTAAITVTGLTNGTAYDFQVAAVNAVGTGAFSTPTSGLTPSASKDSVILSDSPTSFWKLNEASGTTAADSGSGGNPGTYTGTYTLNQTGVGDGEGAVLLDGVSGYVPVPQASNLRPTTTPFSVETWFYPTATPTARAVVCSNPFSTGVGYCLGFGFSNAGSKPQFGAYQSSAWHVVEWSGTAPALNTWHQFVGTWDGSNFRLYLDGVQESSGPVAFAGPISYDAGEFRIGREFTAGYIQGREAKVAFFPSALSAARVLAHFNA